MAACPRPQRSAPARLICWRPGMGGSRSANCKVSSRTSPSHSVPPSMGVTAPPAGGIRIKAGAARSYYIGLETSMPAIPGYKPPVKALCVVPQGMQEGTELLIEGREFGLVTGRAAEFRFFSSSVRSGDTPGQILPDAERELDDAGLLEVAMPI